MKLRMLNVETLHHVPLHLLTQAAVVRMATIRQVLRVLQILQQNTPLPIQAEVVVQMVITRLVMLV
jgi:hypothetical protein